MTVCGKNCLQKHPFFLYINITIMGGLKNGNWREFFNVDVLFWYSSFSTRALGFPIRKQSRFRKDNQEGISILGKPVVIFLAYTLLYCRGMLIFFLYDVWKFIISHVSFFYGKETFNT